MTLTKRLFALPALLAMGLSSAEAGHRHWGTDCCDSAAAVCQAAPGCQSCNGCHLPNRFASLRLKPSNAR